MIGIEYRKLWTKTTILAIVALMIASFVITGIVYLKCSATTVTKNGKMVTGVAAFHTLQREAEAIEGKMDGEYLRNLVQAYNGSQEKRYKDYGMMKYQYPNYLVNFAAYSERMNSSFLDLDFDFLGSEKKFYDQYKSAVMNLLKINNQRSLFPYTDTQINILNQKVKSVKAPFTVGYYEGLSRVISTYSDQYWLLLVVLAFAFCPLFSKDSDIGLDELTLASKLGRKKNMNARIIAGNLFAATVYGIFIGCILLEHGPVASLHGLGLSAQNIWRTCLNNMSIGTGMLVMFAQGLLGVLIITNLIMMISIWTRYLKLSALVSLASVLILTQITGTVNTVQLQLNPIYFARYAAISSDFDLYYFIGTMLIPYSLIILVLTAFYLLIIRLLTIARYKRYCIH